MISAIDGRDALPKQDRILNVLTTPGVDSMLDLSSYLNVLNAQLLYSLVIAITYNIEPLPDCIPRSNVDSDSFIWPSFFPSPPLPIFESGLLDSEVLSNDQTA